MLFDILDNLQNNIMREIYDKQKIEEFKSRRHQDIYTWLDEYNDNYEEKERSTDGIGNL